MDQIAILISLFSVVVAGTSLGWNIYRDVVLKARVRVDFGVRLIIRDAMPERPKYIVLTATNFGPGAVNLSMIQAKYAPLRKKIGRSAEHAVVMWDHTNPLSVNLPTKVEPGDRVDFLLPYDDACMLKRDWTHVGISDFFGRVHWASSKQIKAARREWLKDFAQQGAGADSEDSVAHR